MDLHHYHTISSCTLCTICTLKLGFEVLIVVLMKIQFSGMLVTASWLGNSYNEKWHNIPVELKLCPNHPTWTSPVCKWQLIKEWYRICIHRSHLLCAHLPCYFTDKSYWKSYIFFKNLLPHKTRTLCYNCCNHIPQVWATACWNCWWQKINV